MSATHVSDLDLRQHRFDVSKQIEKLLLRRDLVGSWTPKMQAEYLGLCDQEQSLIERLNQDRFVTV